MTFCRKNERGQAIVLTVLSLVVIMGMAALVLDVGAWFHTKRQLQATSDAAALAGAQALPGDPSGAKAMAMDYANQNGGNVLGADIVVTSTYGPNDTISVKGQKTETGVFSKVLGINTANIDASAKARVDQPVRARWVAPITVNQAHPLIRGTSNCPCFGQMTTLPLGKASGGARQDAPGAFNMVNLDGTRGGISPATLADWMLRGYDGYLGLGDYYSDPGAKFNSSQMQSALAQRKNSVLLFPVYDTLTGNGANAHYHVIGWIGFYMTDYDARGSGGTLTGYFTEFIAQGILNQSGPSGQPNFGVRSIQLIG
jgi:Flp pilus assembly protein TadG